MTTNIDNGYNYDYARLNATDTDESQVNELQYYHQASVSSSILAAKIGIFDFVVLMMMWGICFATSIRNLGRIPGIIFCLLNVLLVLKHANNGVLVLLMLFFAPNVAMLIPRIFVISAVIAFIGYVVHGYFSNIGKIFNPVFFFSVALVTFLAFTVIIAPNRESAVFYYVKYIEGLVALLLVLGLIKNLDDIGRTFKWWAIVAGLSVFIAATHYLLGTNSFLYYLTSLSGERTLALRVEIDSDYVGRLLWAGKDPNGHSGNLVFVLAVAIAFFNIAKSTAKIFWMIITCLILVAIIGTFSRSGFLAAGVIVGFYFMRRNIRAFVPIIIISFVCMILLQFMPELASRLLGIGEAIQRGASGRFTLWKQAIVMWLNSPIWGAGMAAYTEKYYNAAHNSFLQVLAEGGIIGLTLYVFVGLSAVKSCARIRHLYSDKKHPDTLFVWITASGLVAMMMMLFTITYQDIKIFWIECGVCALIYPLFKESLDSQIHDEQIE